MTTEIKAKHGRARGGLQTAPTDKAGKLPLPASKEQIGHAVNALNSIELSTLTGEQLEQVVGFASLQEAIRQLQTEAIIAKHDINKLANDWLATYDSTATVKSYKTAINSFLQWLKVNELHGLTATSKDIDSYAAYCRAEYKEAAANIRINAIGSFYSILQKWEIRPSPCIKIKRAVTSYTVKTIPTSREIKRLIKTAPTAIGAAIELMAKTGLRVGSLHTLKVNRRRRRHYTGTSKGKTIAGVLPDGITLKDIEAIQANSKAAFIRKVERYIAKAGFTPHDLRHAFAVKVYQESGKDIEQVRRALGHSNIAITTTYLQGLPTE